MYRYQVGGLKDTLETRIPFFDQYPILGNKSLDYSSYREVAFLMKDNKHLTPKGLESCFEFKLSSNTNREYPQS
jgi:hypothetical protein